MKILIIEDEKLLADSLKALLEKKGFEVECVYDGEAGEEYAALGIYDLLILDVMMPKMNGYQVARSVRAKRCGTPILMLTARSSLEDRIEGLNAGADYYLTKPFDSRELLACINALLRRQGAEVNELALGNTSLDLGGCMLVCGSKSVRLSAKEFDVMRFFLQSKNSVLSKEVILARVWGYDSNAVENHVEVYVGFLRKKLQSIGSNIRIASIRRLPTGGRSVSLRNITFASAGLSLRSDKIWCLQIQAVSAPPCAASPEPVFLLACCALLPFWGSAFYWPIGWFGRWIEHGGSSVSL